MNDRRFIKVTTGGSHRDMGVDFGRAVGMILRELVVESESLYRRHFGKDVAKVRAFALRNLLPHARRRYPKYVLELEGIAEGANIPFEELFFITADEELAELWQGGEHCSSAAARTSRGMVLAHNEDYPPRYMDRLVIVDAKPDDAPAFLAVTYPYMLCGPSCGINGAGMAFAANSLRFPPARTGVPTNFILRDLYRAESVVSAVRAMRVKGALMGNAAMVASSEDDAAVAIEARPDGGIDVLRMGSSGILAHTNHVRSLSLRKDDEDPTFDSRARLAALEHLLRPGRLTVRRIKDTLSSEEYGLHRPVQGPHDSCTVASVVLHPSGRAIEVAKRGRHGHDFLRYRMRSS